jgi:hypothetical protein
LITVYLRLAMSASFLFILAVLLGVPTGSGSTPEPMRESTETSVASAPAVPETPIFTWGDYNGYNWMTSVKDELGCACASVFAIAGMYEARYRIMADDPEFPIDLSEQYAISCSGNDCGGCYLGATLEFFQTDGCVDEACYPYTASNEDCNNRCSNWDIRLFYADTNSVLSTPSESEVETEIMTNGPVMAIMDKYEDFETYSGGIYSHQSGALVGSQLVVLYGWGLQGDTAYWLGKNSWGTAWGEAGPDGQGGWFRILKGVNEANIEFRAYTITPILRPDCCISPTGNVDSDPSGLVDIGDLTALISFLYIPPNPAPLCMKEANIDGDLQGLVDIGDLTGLISYLYIPPNPEPAPCQ